MTTLVAGSAFDMNDLIANGSLSEFFDFGEVVTGTGSQFVVQYSDETIDEELSLTGTFGNYVDGYPTTGTITGASYVLNGATLFTLSDISISVAAFTDFVMADDLAGLFAQLLSGADEISGSGHADVLLGFDGDDAIHGGTGNDLLDGGDGNDILYTGGGADHLFGGAGDDTLVADGNIGGKILFDGGAGNDTLRLTPGAASLTSPVGNFVPLMFGGGGESLTGIETIAFASVAGQNLWAIMTLDQLTGVSTLRGGAGNDLLIINVPPVAGAFTLKELDLVDWSDATDRVILSAGGSTVSVTLTAANHAGVYGLTGGTVNDVLNGSAGIEVLIGNAGDDLLDGRGGLDQMNGGEGSDLYMIGSAADHPNAEIADNGAAGTDELRFAATGTAQTLVLRAGDTGLERIVIGTGTGSTATITGLLAHGVDARALADGVTIVGNSGANTIHATAFADAIEGGNGNDRFYAYAGDDLLDGGRGADIMYGGAGNDSYVVDDLQDAPIETADEGVDTVLASVAHTLKANVEHLTQTGIYSIHGRGNADANTMTGNSGSNRLWGEAGNDTLTGNDGNDQLDGGTGDDTLVGGAGNDIYFVDSELDTVTEAADEGRDTVRSDIDWTLGDNVEWLELQGSADLYGAGNGLDNVLKGNGGANFLVGEGGNDKIYAGAGDDQIYGNDGNDWLEGGAGKDWYIGGTGSDRFVFRDGDFGGTSFSTADAIQDFGDAEGDRIHLSVVDANTTTEGNQAFTWLGTSAFTGAAGELRYYQLNDMTYVIGDLDGDGQMDFMIRLVGTHDLGTDDFIF